MFFDLAHLHEILTVTIVHFVLLFITNLKQLGGFFNLKNCNMKELLKTILMHMIISTILTTVEHEMTFIGGWAANWAGGNLAA